MKRRPLIIAAVVTVAALACVVPVWEDVWLWVGYSYHDGSGLKSWFDEEKNPVSDDMYGWKKRWSIFPGPDYILPNQTCTGCLHSHIQSCANDVIAIAPDWHISNRPPHVHEFRCICPDLVHRTCFSCEVGKHHCEKEVLPSMSDQRVPCACPTCPRSILVAKGREVSMNLAHLFLQTTPLPRQCLEYLLRMPTVPLKCNR